MLGEKGLKAITCKRGKVRRSSPTTAKLNELVKPLFVDAKEFGGGAIFNWGTGGGVSGAARGGWLPIKNYTTSIFEEHEKVSGQYLRGNFEWKTNPCWACQMGCCKLMTVTEGPYAGYSGEEPEYEGLASMASQIGITEAGAATMLANECDSLGFDVNELGWLLGWVIECFERGLLTKEQLDGLEPRWNDPESALALMKKIATRDGCGDWLAEGVMRASQHIGGEAATRRSTARRALAALARSSRALGRDVRHLHLEHQHHRGHVRRHPDRAAGPRRRRRTGSTRTRSSSRCRS